MSDNSAVTKAGDPDRVNLTEPQSRAFWARRFEVPIGRVQDAVATVGTDPEKVSAHLGKPWPYEASGIV